jgi:hypothetical protein
MERPDLNYPSVLPYPAAATVSNHSSPASAKSAGSPREPVLDTLPAVHASPKIGSPTFPLSQLHVPSPPRPFDYSFGVVPSIAQAQHLGQPVMTPVSAVAPEWATMHSPSDPSGLMYQSSQDSNGLFFGMNAGQMQTHAPANLYYPYDDGSGLGMNMGLNNVGALPNPTFAGPGLPFTGLDFIRNYSTGGFSNTADDALWQSIDPRAFHVEPDGPWSLMDLPPIEETQ